MAADINTQLQNITTDVTAISNLVNRLVTIFSSGGVANPDIAAAKAELQTYASNAANITTGILATAHGGTGRTDGMVTDVYLGAGSTALSTGVLKGFIVNSKDIDMSVAPYDGTSFYNMWGDAEGTTDESIRKRKSRQTWGTRLVCRGGNTDQFTSILEYYADSNVGNYRFSASFGTLSNITLLKDVLIGFRSFDFYVYVDLTAATNGDGTEGRPFNNFSYAFEQISACTGIAGGASFVIYCKTGDVNPTIHLPASSGRVVFRGWGGQASFSSLYIYSSVDLYDIKSIYLGCNDGSNVRISSGCAFNTIQTTKCSVYIFSDVTFFTVSNDINEYFITIKDGTTCLCNSKIILPAANKKGVLCRSFSFMSFYGNGIIEDNGTALEFTCDDTSRIVGYVPAVNKRSLYSTIGLIYIIGDYFSPRYDNVTNLGDGVHRFGQLFAASATINTSDEREKTNIIDVSNTLFKAWEEVGFKQFQFIEAVDKKGNNARVHIGLVAQPVQQIFNKYGLDATKYGFFCFDSWNKPAWDEEIEISPAEYEFVEIVDVPESYETGPAKTHIEQRLVREAVKQTIHHDAEIGERYGIRYEEALCIEAAYQRWKNTQLESRLAALEAKMK